MQLPWYESIESAVICDYLSSKRPSTPPSKLGSYAPFFRTYRFLLYLFLIDFSSFFHPTYEHLPSPAETRGRGFPVRLPACDSTLVAGFPSLSERDGLPPTGRPGIGPIYRLQDHSRRPLDRTQRVLRRNPFRSHLNPEAPQFPVDWPHRDATGDGMGTGC